MPDPHILRKGPHETLTVDGEVEEPVELDRADGGIAGALDQARPTGVADHGTVYSGDGLFQASIPLDVLRRASLAGGRLQIEESPTKCWLVKDVVRVELTRGRQPDSLPPEERSKT